MKIGRLEAIGPCVFGSRCVVSPDAIITQPRESMEFVKKSPRRRSLPVATQSVPPWQTEFWWIGRPDALTLAIEGLLVSAPSTRAS